MNPAYRIRRIELKSADLSHLIDFYQNVLGLRVIQRSPGILVRAGTTEICFSEAASADPFYHFAFDIPANQFAAAKEWLIQRVKLVMLENGRDEIDFPRWKADACYFRDPAGNILEFIARHALENDTNGPFGSDQILAVSEIGVVVNDVSAFVRDAENTLRMKPYLGTYSGDFAAIGDEHGLLICVQRGRAWLGGGERVAETFPLRVTLSGAGPGRLADPHEHYEICIE